MSRGALITPICVPFYVRSPEGNFFFLHGEDFSVFFPEPFPGVITITAAIIITIITVITFTVIIITLVIIISGILIRVKVFPFREIF